MRMQSARCTWSWRANRTNDMMTCAELLCTVLYTLWSTYIVHTTLHCAHLCICICVCCLLSVSLWLWLYRYCARKKQLGSDSELGLSRLSHTSQRLLWRSSLNPETLLGFSWAVSLYVGSGWGGGEEEVRGPPSITSRSLAININWAAPVRKVNYHLRYLLPEPPIRNETPQSGWGGVFFRSKEMEYCGVNRLS